MTGFHELGVAWWFLFAYFCLFDYAGVHLRQAFDLPRWAPQHWELMWIAWAYFGLGMFTYTVGIGGIAWIR